MTNLEQLAALRGILPGDECPACAGIGTRAYGDPEGVLTTDVCDRCWGSGGRRPWSSHRDIAGLRRWISELREENRALRSMIDAANRETVCIDRVPAAEQGTLDASVREMRMEVARLTDLCESQQRRIDDLRGILAERDGQLRELRDRDPT